MATQYASLDEIKKELDGLFTHLQINSIGKLGRSSIDGNKFTFQGEVLMVYVEVYRNFINNNILLNAWSSGFTVNAKKGNISNDPNWKIFDLEFTK